MAVEANTSLAKDAYAPGERIEIAFSFKNLSSQTLAFAFPPSFRIETLDSADTANIPPAGAAQKSLSPGGVESYSVELGTQKDDDGTQVAGRPVSNRDAQREARRRRVSRALLGLQFWSLRARNGADRGAMA